MSLTEIREHIGALSLEERIEISEWLQLTLPEEEEDEAYLQETVALAERRSEEMRTGKVQPLSEEDFWARAESAKTTRRAS